MKETYFSCNLFSACVRATKLDQIEHFGLSKKAAVISNFCLFGKIHHNFLVPKMIKLGCKTFMSIQTLGLHRVFCYQDILTNTVSGVFEDLKFKISEGSDQNLRQPTGQTQDNFNFGLSLLKF